MAAFGISVNQAPTNQNHYLATAPENVVSNNSGRTYVRGARFGLILPKPDADRYLSGVVVVGRKDNPEIAMWVAIDCFPIDTAFYIPKARCQSLASLLHSSPYPRPRFTCPRLGGVRLEPETWRMQVSSLSRCTALRTVRRNPKRAMASYEPPSRRAPHPCRPTRHPPPQSSLPVSYGMKDAKKCTGRVA